MATLIEMLIKYLVIPLFSKLIVMIVSYFQEKKEESERNSKIDKAVEDFKNAETKEDKEAAFFALVRGRKSD
jgi:hypothetical protein